jgi:hypothetical protein
VIDLGAILDIDCVWNPNLRGSIGMDWQVVEWVVDEWCSGWVKSDKCKVYLLYCIDISGECPFVFVKIGALQKQPASVSKVFLYSQLLFLPSPALISNKFYSHVFFFLIKNKIYCQQFHGSR